MRQCVLYDSHIWTKFSGEINIYYHSFSYLPRVHTKGASFTLSRTPTLYSILILTMLFSFLYYYHHPMYTIVTSSWRCLCSLFPCSHIIQPRAGALVEIPATTCCDDDNNNNHHNNCTDIFEGRTEIQCYCYCYCYWVGFERFAMCSLRYQLIGAR